MKGLSRRQFFLNSLAASAVTLTGARPRVEEHSLKDTALIFRFRCRLHYSQRKTIKDQVIKELKRCGYKNTPVFVVDPDVDIGAEPLL